MQDKRPLLAENSFAIFGIKEILFPSWTQVLCFVENVGQMLRQARAKGGGEWKKSERALEHSL